MWKDPFGFPIEKFKVLTTVIKAVMLAVQGIICSNHPAHFPIPLVDTLKVQQGKNRANNADTRDRANTHLVIIWVHLFSIQFSEVTVTTYKRVWLVCGACMS